MKNKILKNIGKLITIKKRYLYSCILFIFIVSGLEILSLSIFSNLISSLQGEDWETQENLFKSLHPHKDSAIIFLILILLLSIVLKFIINVFLNLNLMTISITNENNLKQALLKKYLKSVHNEFLSHDQGHFLYHFQQLTKTFSEFLLLPLIRMISDITVALTISLYLIWVDPILFFNLFTIFTLFYFLYNYFFKSKLRNFGEKYNLASQNIIGDFKSLMQGKDQIKHYSYWDQLVKNMQIYFDQYKQNYIKAVIISNMPRYLVEVNIGIAVAVYVLASFTLGFNKETVMTSLGVMGFAAVRLVPIVNQIFVSINQINANLDSLNRLYNDLELQFKSDLNLSNSFANITDIELIFQKSHMTLQIDDRREKIIFSDFSVKTGSLVSIVGKSGSGKSSLAKIICGLVPLTSGVIYLNGKKVTPDQSSLMQSITSYSPQETFVLERSIQENIVFGRNYDSSALKQAIYASNADEFIYSLPGKENTIIGANGVRLSGGQLQRLQIARTLYLARPIIVLDEPTSALNSASATKIVERIKSIYQNKLIFIITHDEKLSKLTDIVINFDKP